jgi:predicted permease
MIRHAARALVTRPAFAITAVLTLALGIGASMSVYALVRGLYFRAPDGIVDADRLVGISQHNGTRAVSESIRYPDYLYYREHQTVFSALASHFWYVVPDTERSAELNAFFVSSNYFPVLGVNPALGSFFGADSENDRVAVLSYAFWQRRFDGDPNCLGRTLILGGVPFTIAGVAAPDFNGVLVGWPVDVFLPTAMGRTAFPSLDIRSRDSAHLNLIGKLKPGRGIEDARAEMTVLARQLEQAFPETNRDLGVILYPLHGVHPEMWGEISRLITLLAAAVGCLLLAACVNLAGLLMARNVSRAKDIAIQLALGAGRSRIVQQLMIESLLMSLAGGVASLPVAVIGNTVLARYVSVEIEGTHHLYDISLDWSAFVACLALAMLTGLLFGVIPALRASRPDIIRGLNVRSTASGFHRSWLRTGLLAAQIALSAVALVGAGLAAQSVGTLRWNASFDPDRVAFVRVKPFLVGYDAERTTRYLKRLQERLSSLNQVESFAFARWPPAIWPQSTPIFLPDQAPSRPEDAFQVKMNGVTPGYFETLRIPIVEGRGFEPRDLDADRHSIVVNQALAERLWPRTDAIGQTLMVGSKPYVVVGIARYQDVQPRGDAQRPFLFRAEFGGSRLLMRLRGDAERLLPGVVREIAAVDPNMAIGQQSTLTSVLENTYAPVTLTMMVLTFTAGLTLLLTAIGLYGALALAVGQRTREIGIRMALGARPAGILGLILREGVAVTLGGIAIGVVAATMVTGLLSSYLYGVQRNDPLTFFIVAVLLVLVAGVACALPASRAAQIDPNVALRQD